MNYDSQSEAFEQDLQAAAAKIQALKQQMSRRVIGQQNVVDGLIMAALAGGHVLLEGLPGLAKTTSVVAFSEAARLSFSRIQFTPDLLPADVIGTQIFHQGNNAFQVHKGPIFANLVLADEINRSPAKVQAALLEAMQEKQVTIGDQSWPLAPPFLVMATQNPIEQEGTYPLPEAQLDRFLFKLTVEYGTPEEELQIMELGASKELPPIETVMDGVEIRQIGELAQSVHVSEKVRRYIVDLIFATREPEKRGLKDLAGMLETGASPRASLCLDRVAKVRAVMEGRSYVTPQDIKDIGMDILRHRVRPSFEAEAQSMTSESIIQHIFERVEVP